MRFRSSHESLNDVCTPFQVDTPDGERLFQVPSRHVLILSGKFHPSVNLPLGISSARKKRAELLVGGILGSFAYNLFVTLGLAATIRPLPVTWQEVMVTLAVMIGVHLLLLALVWYGNISRWIGACLIGGYGVYLLAVVLHHG